MLSIGVRAHDYGSGSPQELFQRISADGFTGIQLAFKKAITGVKIPGDVTPTLLDNTKQALAASQLDVTVLGAYVELSLADQAARQAQLAEFCAYLPVAKALHAGCIGSETTPMHLQPGITRDQAFDCLIHSLSQIMPQAEQLGVTVGVEPVFTHTMNTPEITRKVLDTIASPNLKVIFDPVNLLHPDLINTQKQLWDRSFDAFGDKIAAVHFKGAGLNPQGEIHSVPFERSVVDYGYIVSMLKGLNRPICILREEAKPANAKQDIAFIRALM